VRWCDSPAGRCLLLAVAIVIVQAACSAGLEDHGRAEGDSMNQSAERYVKLVLAVGQHDADYVDAYYGPPAWRKDAASNKRPLAEIDADAAASKRRSPPVHLPPMPRRWCVCGTPT
jgi:hypothetical protein